MRSPAQLSPRTSTSTAFRPSPEEIAYHPTPEGLDFRYKGESQAEFEERERRCLAIAIYFEARGEPVRGQVAVGQVILNRVRSPLFPETICGVVYQGQMQTGCQFSFTCDGHTDIPRNDDQWALAQDIAKQITAGELWLPEVGYSTYLPRQLREPELGRQHEQDRQDRPPHLLQEAQRGALYRRSFGRRGDGAASNAESGVVDVLAHAGAVPRIGARPAALVLPLQR